MGPRREHLHRLSIDNHVSRSQDFLPPDHFVDTLCERTDAEPAGNPERNTNVVSRSPRLELFEEPQTLLSEGKGRCCAGGRYGNYSRRNGCLSALLQQRIKLFLLVRRECCAARSKLQPSLGQCVCCD